MGVNEMKTESYLIIGVVGVLVFMWNKKRIQNRDMEWALADDGYTAVVNQAQGVSQAPRRINEGDELLDYWWSGLSYFDDVQET